SDDRDALRRAAHKLRGEAVTLDFSTLAQQLQVLESDAHALDRQQLAALNENLRQESRRLTAWLTARGVNA
ncbi:Hpt domain-containing protein, partial [Enterobacter sp. C6]